MKPRNRLPNRNHFTSKLVAQVKWRWKRHFARNDLPIQIACRNRQWFYDGIGVGS